MLIPISSLLLPSTEVTTILQRCKVTHEDFYLILFRLVSANVLTSLPWLWWRDASSFTEPMTIKLGGCIACPKMFPLRLATRQNNFK